MDQKWEYRVVSEEEIRTLQFQLNELGSDGFEVVGVAMGYDQQQGRGFPLIVLKRPKR
jgi:hypothetical protein